MSIDAAIISYALKKPSAFAELRRAGVTEDYFVEDEAKVWRWLCKTKNQHGRVPSTDVVSARYPDLEIMRVRDRDFGMLFHDLQQRKKYMDFLDLLSDATMEASSPDDVDNVVARLQGSINSLSTQNGKSSIVDFFSPEMTERMLKDQKRRRKGTIQGIPTGLKRFDGITGGLQKQRMVTIIARPGKGKSWLNLLFVASAVTYGAKVVLYPLEMSLEDTALRLYTIFSCKMMGPSKSLKNLDLLNGVVSPKKVARFLAMLEDRYQGQLFVADMGTMSDPYTVERIDSETELYKPDLFWIDYITLMKSPVGRDGAEDHTTIKALSNGVKQIAVRRKCVGGVSAQVNREAIRGHSFLPRLENIAYGDSIGQDSDHVIGANRKDEHLYYALVKNRHGPETGKIRVKFAVNEGDISETERQPDEEDNDSD